MLWGSLMQLGFCGLIQVLKSFFCYHYNDIFCRLSELCSVHRVHKHEMEDMDSRLEACQLNAEKFQEKIRSLEERYRFFQEMRGYVRDLVECLNEKVG